MHQSPLRKPLARATSPAHPSQVRSCSQVHPSLLLRPSRRVACHEQEHPRLVSPLGGDAAPPRIQASPEAGPRQIRKVAWSATTGVDLTWSRSEAAQAFGQPGQLVIKLSRMRSGFTRKCSCTTVLRNPAKATHGTYPVAGAR